MIAYDPYGLLNSFHHLVHCNVPRMEKTKIVCQRLSASLVRLWERADLFLHNENTSFWLVLSNFVEVEQPLVNHWPFSEPR